MSGKGGMGGKQKKKRHIFLAEIRKKRAKKTAKHRAKFSRKRS